MIGNKNRLQVDYKKTVFNPEQSFPPYPFSVLLFYYYLCRITTNNHAFDMKNWNGVELSAV